MLYIVRVVGGFSIYESGDKLHRAGDRVGAGEVVSPAVTDYFLERFADLVEEEFFSFQTDNGIDDGGLPAELEAELHAAVDAMVLAIAKAKAWQLAEVK